jgi:hypothetical protein
LATQMNQLADIVKRHLATPRGVKRLQSAKCWRGVGR